MFDVAPSELLLVGLVALIVVGPKDLPRLMRTVGKWVSQGRNLAHQFRAGFDQMMREAELAEEREKAAQTAPHVTSPAIAPEIAPPLPPEGTIAADAGTPAAAPGSRADALAAWNARQGDTGPAGGAGASEALASDALAPEAGRPESGMPEAGMPESGMPEAGRPESGMPGAGQPEAAPAASAAEPKP